ncbi:MAG: hypothetical protein IPO21_18340 [Bacteroidales bacterium]|nr:hypothetical protein [Bacteroidales bacterium]
MTFIFVIALFTFLVGQNNISISGTVTDAGTRKPLQNATIHLADTSYKTLSQSEGNFSLHVKLYSDQDSDSLIVRFSHIIDVLSWNFNTPAQLRMFALNGDVIFNQNSANTSGSVSTAMFKNAYFIIQIISDKGKYTYKALFINNELFISKLKLSSNPEKLDLDSLYLQKENYYDRTIALDSTSMYDFDKLNIQLLNKQYFELSYFNELIRREAFDMIKSSPPKTNFGEVESIKVIVDSSSGLVYYINSQIYTDHYSFATDMMDYPYSHHKFNSEQYNAGSSRYLYPITLNYFKDLDVYTFEFFSGDGATCSEVEWCYEKILQTSYIKNNLLFYSTNASWDLCKNVPTITPNEIFNNQNYQALNVAKSYGYLRKIDFEKITTESIQKHDIVLTNGVPIDIPVVAGLITTEFQTPLSHVNVLSHNRGTPNMGLRDGFQNPKLDSLLNQLVYLEVSRDSFYIRSATIEEATIFWNSIEPSNPITLEKDTYSRGLIDLEKASINDIKKIGGKAANFAELYKAFNSMNMEAPLPENYFAIPFYYYQSHLEKYGLQTFIAEMINNNDFNSNTEVKKRLLKKLQDSIINSPLDTYLLDLVTTQLLKDKRFSAYRFRSSTNAEDIEGFNGAGLYESFTGKIDDNEKPVDMAIKKVWASLWNYAAFEEREYFKINQQSCAMGILVQRTFGEEDANGVIITINPYNANPAYIINVQYNELNVVSPPPNIINDEVVIYTFSILGVEPYTLEYNSYSNVYPNSTEHVMTKEELFTLAEYVTIIKQHFFINVYKCNCSYSSYGLDIEFKVDSQVSPRKIYIKQVRPY